MTRERRNRVRSSAALAPALLVLLPAISAAPGDSPPPPTKVAVVSLADVRKGDSSSRLELELELSDFAAAEVAAARIRVRRAADDTGRDLVPEDARKAAMETVRGESAPGAGETPARAVVPVRLRSPARRAKVLTEVSGEAELYLPGRDPNAVVAIPEIRTWEGKRLENAALSAAGVRIAMLTGEQLAAEKKRRAEARREEARKQGLLGEMMESLVSAFLGAFATPEAGDVVLSVEDKEGRVVGIRLLDAAGEDRTNGRMEQQGLVILSSSRTGPGPDWSLEVRLRTPKSVESRSFTLKGVPLP